MEQLSEEPIVIGEKWKYSLALLFTIHYSLSEYVIKEKYVLFSANPNKNKRNLNGVNN